MAEFWLIYLTGFAILLAILTLLWVVSVWLTDASIIDPFWSVNFLVLGGYYFTQTDAGNPQRKWLLMILLSIWAARLALYLLWRNWGHGEDFRYQAFRQKYGADRYWWVSLFQVFWLQGALAWLVSSPLLGAQIRGGRLNWADFAGIAVWLIGFIFEAGGDYQLTRFKANPQNKGKLLTTGLWRYTRHPNYFGDSACWWGYGLICLAAGSYFALIGAILMTILIIRVSGVSILERSLKEAKPGYEEYMRKTSPFFPLPPKK